MNRTILRTLLLAASLAGAPSCVGDAWSPHSGETAITATDHSYRVWYMAPPWVLQSSMGDHTVLHIPTFNNPHIPMSLDGSISVLTIDVVPGAPAAILASRVATAIADQSWLDQVIYTPRPVSMAGNTMGLETAYGGTTHTVRIAAVQLSATRTLVLSFESVEDIENDPDITDMLHQVEVGVSP